MSKTKSYTDSTHTSVHDNGHWIQGAIKHKGALHRELGIPQGQKIPAKTLSKAANSDNPTLARRARLAQTLGKMNRG